MMFKNTFKILFANYSKVWRVLLYVIIAGAITCGLAVAVGFPIYNKLVAEGIFVDFTDIYAEFMQTLNLQNLFVNIAAWLTDFAGVIFGNLDTLLLFVILLFVVLTIVGSLIVGSYKFGITGSVNYYMNSCVNTPFASNMIAHAGKSMAYHLFNTVILLPINLMITALVVVSLNLLTNVELMWLAPFVAMFVFAFLNALAMTIFGGWIPAMIVKNKNVFGGLKECFRVMTRRFIYTFGSAFAMVLTLVFINVFGGLCTFGVGLIVTIPSTLVIVEIFNMVAYYTAIGQRYYVDSGNVCAPKRQEFTDKFSEHKFII